LNNENITTKINHFLYPSALFASKEPYLVTTILGSCVAVCFWDKINKIGGINHYMLPLWNGQGLASPKYGNIAINKLYEKMLQLGSKKQNIQAKIFGGGEVIETKVLQYSIGQRNIEIADDLLKELSIQIVSSSVGGKKGRKILFDTFTGEVRLKFILKIPLQLNSPVQ
jgi:chemotaxis protein CheD